MSKLINTKPKSQVINPTPSVGMMVSNTASDSELKFDIPSATIIGGFGGLYTLTETTYNNSAITYSSSSQIYGGAGKDYGPKPEGGVLRE